MSNNEMKKKKLFVILNEDITHYDNHRYDKYSQYY